MLLRKKDSKRQTTILLLFLIVSFNGKALLENGYSWASFPWLIVLRTLHPCSAKRLAGAEGERLSPAGIFFFSHQLGKTASWISQWFNSLVHRADICLCRSTYSVISVEKKTRIYKIRQTSWMLLRVKNAQKYNPSFYGRY